MLQIPVKDASTHDAAIVLGAELDAGKYMYTDLQRTYISASETPNYHPTTTSQNGKTGAMKPSDYDHISGQNFFTTFPTSSADIECMFQGQSSINSVVPQPSLSRSTPSPDRTRDVLLAPPHH